MIQFINVTRKIKIAVEPTQITEKIQDNQDYS